ncbi:MAG: gliding motility protein GldN [Mucilaginibacter sp.]|uniref:type IX secretion system ring protein PorN/GldN n=1 Tax=Mucilaginibacter sp. TaxID=1882438 RepID=UPI003267E1FB
MKKAIVLIVLLLITGSFTLLAQINKSDTSTSKTGVAKPVVSNLPTDTGSNSKTKTTDNQDKKAVDQTLKQTAQKSKADSVATTTVSKATPGIANPSKADTVITAKDTLHTVNDKSKIDTTATAKKNLSEKDLKKLNSKKNGTDTLSAKSKEKPPKGKSAKELKREAKKNDVNKLSEKALSQMAFKQIGSDSSIRNAATKRADISFTNARPLPLDEFTPNNIRFYHRYWRDIDLQDTKNKRFATYHSDLIYALLKAIKAKEIKAYNPAASAPNNPNGDAFTIPIPYEELMSGLSDTSVVNVLDKDGNITGTKTVPNPFTPEKISGYRIKEDVFYDKTRSRYITRIIGIAPLIKLTLTNGDLIGIQPLCWLRFKDCRKILVTIDIDPTKKIGESMDDVFLQRRFYGKIVQESNPDGKRIKDYKPEPPDQEIEAKRIEQKVITYKKGTWNYTMLIKSSQPEPIANKPVEKNKATAKTKKEKNAPVKP